MDFETALQGFLISITADGYSEETITIYKWGMSILCDYLKNKPVEQITGEDLQGFFIWVRADYKPTRANKSTEPLAGRSVDNIWTAMRSFFRWMVQEKYITGHPDYAVKRPKYKSREVPPFSHDEIDAILGVCERTIPAKTEKRDQFTMPRQTAARDVALVMVLLDTGLRVSECARLKIQDVDIITGEVTVQPYGTAIKTKGRHVFIGKVTKKAIWRYLAQRETPQPTERLFLTIDSKPMDRNSIALLIRSLGRRAGVKNAHPHRFRHTFALEYLRNGGDPFTLQRLLGHSSMDVVNKYLQMVGSDLEAAHRRASPVDRWRL